MQQLITLKDEQRGSVDLTATLAPVAGYLRDHAHWIPVGFRPLTVRRLGDELYRLTLPSISALGFELAPQVALRPIEDADGTYRLVSVEQPELDYRIDFDSLLGLRPTGERTVAVDWKTRFAISLELPGFLRMLPQGAVRGAAQVAVSAMIGSVCRSLVDNLCRDYRSRSGHPE